MKKLLLIGILFIQLKINAQTEIPLAEAPIDSLSPIMNKEGQNVTWELENLNYINYAAMEHDTDLVASIKPEWFRTHYPILNMNDSLYDSIPIKSYDSNLYRIGYYTAKYEAIGTLKLPTEIFNNVYKIKIIENYRILNTSNSVCLKYKNQYNYFFVDDVLKPVLCYSEKKRYTCDESLYEYFKEITRPALDSLNNSQGNNGLGNLISFINLICSPNPSNSVTNISYNLPQNGHVKLILENTANAYSNLIENTNKAAGCYSTNLPLVGVMPGIYYIKLFFKGNIFTKQLVIN